MTDDDYSNFRPRKTSSRSYDDFLLETLKEYSTNSCIENSFDEFNDGFIEYSCKDLLCDYYTMLAITDSTSTEQFFNESIDEKNNDDGRLSLAFENLKFIPKTISESTITNIKYLDLSFNSFKNLTFLSHFKILHTLILDRNSELDESTFPYLGKLEILWLNNCNILNLLKWIYRVQMQCPNIRHLSLLGNPGAKTQLVQPSISLNEENDFRMLIFERLPTLNYLDGVLREDLQINDANNTNNINQIDKKFPQKLSAVVANNTIDDSTSKNLINCLNRNNFRNIFRFAIKRKRTSEHNSSTTTT